MSDKEEKAAPVVHKFRAFDPHPLLSMFPTGSEEDIAAMQKSVEAHGVQQRIRVWKDGRNKYHLIDGTVRQAGAERAFNAKVNADPPEAPLAANGVPLQPEFDEFVGTQDEVYEFIKTCHVRKHYTPGQKAALGVRLYYYEYKKTHSGKLPDPQKEVSGEGTLTAAELALLYGVNEYYIRICRQLYRDAADLLDAVALGVIPPPKAMADLKKRRAGNAPAALGDEDGEGEDDREDGGEKFTDADGADVPDNLNPAWEAKSVYKVLRTALTDARQTCAKLAAMDGGGYIDAGVLDKQLSVALGHLHQSEPVVVCSDCDGKGHPRGQRWDCKRCKGLGYLCRAVLAAEKKAAARGGDEDKE